MALILVITNQSKLADTSDYKYEVLVGDGTVRGSTLISKGTVEQHIRSHGWRILVQRVLDESKDIDNSFAEMMKLIAEAEKHG